MITDDDDVAIAAVTAAELLVGVELASGRHRETRKSFARETLGVLLVEDYALDVAVEHAALLAHVAKSGTPRGAHDLIIAATARASNRAVVSSDRRAFADLPGVELTEPE